MVIVIVAIVGSLLFSWLPERKRHRAEKACHCVCGYIAHLDRDSSLVCLAPGFPDPAAEFKRLQDEALRRPTQ